MFFDAQRPVEHGGVLWDAAGVKGRYDYTPFGGSIPIATSGIAVQLGGRSTTKGVSRNDCAAWVRIQPARQFQPVLAGAGLNAPRRLKACPTTHSCPTTRASASTHT